MTNDWNLKRQTRRKNKSLPLHFEYHLSPFTWPDLQLHLTCNNNGLSFWVSGQILGWVGKDGGGEISAIKVVVVSKKGEGALLKPAGSGHKTSCCFSLFLRIKLCIVAPPRCQEFDRHFIQGACFSRYLPCVSVSVGMRWCFLNGHCPESEKGGSEWVCEKSFPFHLFDWVNPYFIFIISFPQAGFLDPKFSTQKYPQNSKILHLIWKTTWLD